MQEYQQRNYAKPMLDYAEKTSKKKCRISFNLQLTDTKETGYKKEYTIYKNSITLRTGCQDAERKRQMKEMTPFFHVT